MAQALLENGRAADTEQSEANATTKFGDLLRVHRDRSRDPQTGKPLTQGRVADMIAELTKITYSSAAVSDWERNQSQIHKDDRVVLTALIAILHRCGGLTSAEEANTLLAAGNYRSLDPDELARICPDWSAGSGGNAESEQPERSHPLRIFVNILVEWWENPHQQPRRLGSGAGDDLPPDWTDRAAAMFGFIRQHLPPWRVATVAFGGLLTGAIWYAALPLLYWPLGELRDTAVWYVVGAALIPALWAGWEELGRRPGQSDDSGGKDERRARRLLTYTGALVGFQIAFVALLLATVFVYDIWGRSLGESGRIVQLAAAGGVALFSLFGARQAPRNMRRAFGRWQFAEGDAAVLLAILLLGPGVAWLVAHFQTFLLQHTLLGSAVVLVALVAIAVLVLWQERRSGTSVIPAPFWAGLGGAVWALNALQRLDWLEAATALALSAVIVAGLQKGRYRLTLGGLVLLTAACAALGVVLAWNVTFGRVLTAGVALVWIVWGRRQVWFSAPFWLAIAAAVAAEYLAVMTTAPLWAVILGLAILTTYLVWWELRHT